MTKTVGVIGLGSIGIRHAKNLEQLGHSVIGFDPAPQLKVHQDDLKAVINLSDAVVIASPTNLHHQHYMDVVIKGGNKPVFMEKPSADVYDEMLKNITMVGYNLRFHSCVLKAKEWIDAGFLGEPLWANLVCAQFNSKPDYLRDGVILNWSHEIDLALHLLGPADVKACVTREKETLADLILLHANGCQSTIHLDYETKPEIRQSIIVGSDATIIMDLTTRHMWLRGQGHIIMDQFVGTDSFDENYKDEMETFLARVDGQETVGCTGAEGLEVLKICLEAKNKSADDKRWNDAIDQSRIKK